MTRSCLFASIVLLAASVGSIARAQPAASIPYKPALNADDAMKRIEELGGAVRRVSLKDDALEVDFRGSSVADPHLQYLQPLGKVTVLRLRETAITDAGLIHVGKIATLKRLYLEKTSITDAGLRHLTGLKELEYVNLFGADVGDAGLEQLKSLPKIKSLFVWQTKVSPAGIAKLQKATPGIQIVPDPAQDRLRAEAAWKTAKAAVDEAEKDLVVAKKNEEDLAPLAAMLKAELDVATKKSTDAKKVATDAKKKAEELTKRSGELKALADLIQKQAAANPSDLALAKNADEKRLLADRERQLANDAKKAFDEVQMSYTAAQAVTDAIRQRSAKASNAKKAAEDAQKHLEMSRKLEEEARKKLTISTSS